MSVALGHVASEAGGDAPVQERRSGRTGYLLLLLFVVVQRIIVARSDRR